MILRTTAICTWYKNICPGLDWTHICAMRAHSMRSAVNSTRRRLYWHLSISTPGYIAGWTVYHSKSVLHLLKWTWTICLYADTVEICCNIRLRTGPLRKKNFFEACFWPKKSSLATKLEGGLGRASIKDFLRLPLSTLFCSHRTLSIETFN